MVFAVKPVNLLVKFPAPGPSLVILFAVVGFFDVLQHTPRSVTVEPPSLVIMPPPVAAFWDKLVILTVITVGTSSFLHEVNIIDKTNMATKQIE